MLSKMLPKYMKVATHFLMRMNRQLKRVLHFSLYEIRTTKSQEICVAIQDNFLDFCAAVEVVIAKETKEKNSAEIISDNVGAGGEIKVITIVQQIPRYNTLEGKYRN